MDLDWGLGDFGLRLLADLAGAGQEESDASATLFLVQEGLYGC